MAPRAARSVLATSSAARSVVPETAHQIINDSEAELAYISVSTMMPAEVCEYPDSGKVGAFGGSGESRLRHMTMADAKVDYWKGEE